MLKIDLEYNDFVYPWVYSSVVDRLRILTKKDNKKKIVYLYEFLDSSTFRYRVYNMCELSNNSMDYTATYFFLHEWEHLVKNIDYVDYLVIVRVRWSIELDQIFTKAFSRNIKIYFDVDDLVFDVKKVPLLMNTLGIEPNNTNYDFWFSYLGRLNVAASYCDHYITTNDFLSDHIKAYFKKPTFVIHNFINARQMETSIKLCKIKNDNKLSPTDTILLGYFSGTPTHNNDFKSISSDLYDLMKKDRRIKLRLVGYLDVPNNLLDFMSEGRIDRIPLQNYLNLQVKIAECDVNLIPLLNNEFTNGKSEIKYFEASIVDVPSVATPTFIYQKIIENGQNGYLARPGEWGEIIEKIIKPPSNDDIITAARHYSEQNYYGANVLKQFETIFR